MSLNDLCPCGSHKNYENCCSIYHRNIKHAPDAEALMRSRFSAYAKGDYQYIFKTYGATQRAKLSEIDLAEQADSTTWLSLQVLQHIEIEKDQRSQVEFKAYYKIDKRIFVMHERSNFECCYGRWFYTTGVMLDGTKELTLKRNDLCFCGSNKKYKKCCGP